jgi:hypothetical protein
MDEASRRILAEAERYARQRGKRLGPGARSLFEAATVRAAQDLAATRRDQLVRRTHETEVAFHRMIDEMIRAIDEIPGYEQAHPGVIGEETLMRAMRRLCPLFPFC